MYIRLVLPRLVRDYKGDAGFFHKTYSVRDADFGVADWIKLELKERLKWFNKELPVPENIEVHFKRRRTLHGLCWFQPTANECIQRARYVGWLMSEAGTPVREIRTDNPGKKLWKDEFQIVALPHKNLPRA